MSIYQASVNRYGHPPDPAYCRGTVYDQISRCATSPLTARCSSAGGLSYDLSASLSASGALNMER